MDYNSYNSNGSQCVGGMTPPPIPPLPEGYSQIQSSAPQENIQMEAQTNQDAPQENIQMEAQENQCVSQENPQTPPVQEPAKEVEIKKVAVQGGELCMGDYCYARTPLDGLYYFAQIKSFGDAAVNVCFFNGYEASLPFKNVYTVVEAANEMQVFGNARGKGKFFAAKLVEQTPNGFVVCYDDSNLKESLAYAQLRFAVK